MDQLKIQFTPRIGCCQTCGHSGVLNARICRRCEQNYGRRNAELLARARREPEFARACYLEMGPGERAEFVNLLGRASLDIVNPQLLRGLGPSIAKCRSGGTPRLRLVNAAGSGAKSHS